MQIAVAVASIIFIALSGRNDGGPILGLSYQSQRSRAWIPVLVLFITVPAVAWLGIRSVGESLADLFNPGGSGSFGALAALLGVLVTLALAAILNAPTSITLALIGSLTGTSLATTGTVDSSALTRVIVLGLAAPIVAGLMSYGLTVMPFRQIPGGEHAGLVLRAWKQAAFFLMLIAYGANDGQKVMFAVALAFSVTVNDAGASIPLMLGASAIFTLGALFGIRKSTQFIRHGVARTSTLTVLWGQLASATAVLAGSALGTPLSMTQSITGSLVGSAMALSRKAVYWQAIRRVGFAWIWTLPMAGAVSYLFMWLSDMITTW